MNRFFFGIIRACWVISLLLMGFSLFAQENTLQNPDFEAASDGIPLCWQISGSEDAVSRQAAGLTPLEPFSGNASLLLWLQKAGFIRASQRIGIKPGTLYRLSCRVRTDKLKTGGLGAYIGIEETNTISNDFSESTNGWKETTLVFKTAPDQKVMTVFASCGSPLDLVTGAAWFDYFKIEETTTESAFTKPDQAAVEKKYFPADPAPIIVFSILTVILLATVLYISRKQKALFHSRKAHLILAGGLTLVYTLFAFLNLGSFDTPQTFHQPEAAGETVYLDLGRSVELSKVNYFMGLGKGYFSVAFSEDLRTWKAQQRIGQEHKYVIMNWREARPNTMARYIRLVAETVNCEFGEIAFFTPDSTTPLPVSLISGPEAAAVPVTAARLIDEPDRVPYLPSYLNSMYFDETYHARAGYEYTLGRDSSEPTHPPLGKLFIALGIKLFGFTTVGWRFFGTLFGCLMIPLIYAFALRLFKNRFFAFFAAFLLAFDFMHFAQTRIATVDVFGVFWIIALFYFTHRLVTQNPFTCRLRRLFVPIILGGISFGIGAASKWIVLYAGAGVALIVIGWFVWHSFHLFRAHRAAPALIVADYATVFVKRFLLIFSFCVLFFIIISGFIYYLSYIPYIEAHQKLEPAKTSVQLILEQQEYMYAYHANLDKTHDFASPWYAWPFLVKPIWYYTGRAYLSTNEISSISSFGNPAIWWTGVIASFISIFIVLRRRDKTLLFLLAGLATQYVPWIIIPRKLIFIYHFFASVPFIIFLIIYCAKLLMEIYPRARYALFGFTALTFMLFIMFYPVLSGFLVDASYVKNTLTWFPEWYF